MKEVFFVDEQNEPDFSQPPEQPTGGRPGRQTRSQDEMERRISFAACLLSQLVPTPEIKAQLQRRYQCSRRMCENYISHGRERLKQWSEIPPEQVRSEIVAILKGLLRSNLDVRDKLAVIDRLIEIYGLAAPTEHTFRADKENPLAVKSQVVFYIPDNGRQATSNGNGHVHRSVPGAV